MKGTTAIKGKARAIAEEIQRLRHVESTMRSAFAGERVDGELSGAGVSELLAEDFAEKADAIRLQIEDLKQSHANVMSAYANHGGWEDAGVSMCCECGELFFVDELRGGFMARKCPLCGCRLHEAVYDAHARVLARKAKELKRAGDAEGRRIVLKELKRLAMARYLESEWYLLTGTPTSALGFKVTEEGYSFTPAYDKIGVFYLKANYGMHEILGIKGEMTLMDSLRMRVNEKSSPLYGSKVIPNVNLVTNKVKDGRIQVAKNETDCILLTPVGAFVFEVKHWRAKIKVHAPKKYMEVTRGGMVTRLRCDEGPVAQVGASRKALLGHCDALQGDRVCSVVVFADPIELTGDMGNLPCGKGVYFGQVATGGKSSVRKEIENCVTKWSEQSRNHIDADIAELAGNLLAENSRYELPIDPIGRM